MFGRKRRLDDIYSTDNERRAHCERQARNTPIQSGAADITFIAMIKLFKALRGTKTKILLNIHDSIVVETPEHTLKNTCQLMKEVMENAVKLQTPLSVDFKVGKKLGEMDKFKI